MNRIDQQNLCLRRIEQFVHVVLASCLFTVSLFAQGMTVSGVVHDPWGAGLSDVKVTASTSEWELTTLTDEQGFYRFTDLMLIQ